MGTSEFSTQSTQFPIRLGHRLSKNLGVIVLALILAGGISLLLGLQIYGINKHVDRSFSHALAAGEIYDTFHQIIAEVQHIQSTGMFDRFDRLPALRASLSDRIRAFTEFHASEQKDAIEAVEQPIVDGLVRIEADLAGVIDRVERTFGSRVYLPPAEMVRLQDVLDRGARNSKDLRDFHQSRVMEMARENRHLIRLIVVLYLVFLAIGIGLIGVASLVLNRKIATPLVRVADAALEFAEGRLDRRVEVATKDELGQLSHAFNVMAGRLQSRELDLRETQVRLEHKVRETRALYDIGTEILSLQGLDTILRLVADKARELLKVDAAIVSLAQGPGGHPVVRAIAGPPELFQEPAADPGVADACLPYRADCLGSCCILRPESVRGRIAVPLRYGADPLGVLCVTNREPRTFSLEETELLDGLAAQAAIAIENARLYEGAKDAATLEERERLAREMHDGLAQSVGLLHMKLRQARAFLPSADPPRMAEALDEMTAITDGTYDEIRQSIFGLRTMVSQGLGFVPTLAEFLHEWSEQSGVPVGLESDDGETVRVTPLAEIQLIRIVQEALTNVHKHARAARARVTVQRTESGVRILVEDDGRGFDMAHVAARGGFHFGLQGMRERAERLGAKLEIESAPGRGTRISVQLTLNG
jgi:nitrate/nitrite-specific signal transduction histidine kinase